MDENKLNINEANESQWVVAFALDPKLAQRIVAYRQANGPFTDPSSLTAVDGISPTMIDEWGDRLVTEPTAVVLPPARDPLPSTPPPAPAPAPATKTNWLGQISWAIFAAVLGTTLSLSILYGFNNSLHYASFNQNQRQQQQLQTDLQAAQQQQTAVQERLETLEQLISTVEASQGQTAVDITDVKSELEAVATSANQLQHDLAELDSQIDDVHQAATEFDTFLTGLRTLLWPNNQPTPTNTPAQPALSPTPTATAVASPTATPNSPATRTPHPSATPIGQSTNQPAPTATP